jgi:predicted AAA+ superfamily ATPase
MSKKVPGGHSRYLSKSILNDLEKKMVFLAGPRQVGKTTLAQTLLKDYKDGHPGYLNWNSDVDRDKIRERQWPETQKLIVLDEIHKLKTWQTFVKGLYDTLKNTHQFLITGSARLDHYRKGGDSLLGRYYYYRLHPFSLPELGETQENLEKLITYGGFPEPLFEESERELKRWHRSRVSKLVTNDIRDLEDVKDLNAIELLALALPDRVGSPLSLNALAQDLQVSPKTVKRWVEILETLYYCFRIQPFGAPKIKAVKKEQKLYLWDWSQVGSIGERFENLVACHLLKYCHYKQDVEGEEYELRYLRDREKREVDFVVMKDQKPLFAVEVKIKSKELSPHIKYFSERTNIPVFYQVSKEGSERQISDKVKITNFLEFSKKYGV